MSTAHPCFGLLSGFSFSSLFASSQSVSFFILGHRSLQFYCYPFRWPSLILSTATRSSSPLPFVTVDSIIPVNNCHIFLLIFLLYHKSFLKRQGGSCICYYFFMDLGYIIQVKYTNSETKSSQRPSRPQPFPQNILPLSFPPFLLSLFPVVWFATISSPRNPPRPSSSYPPSKAIPRHPPSLADAVVSWT